MYLGVNSGLTYSKFRGDNFFKEMKPQLDYLIGSSLDIQIKERLFLTLNINYERNSVKRYYNNFYGLIGYTYGQAPSSPPKNKFETRFEYITMPVMVKYMLNYEKKLYINGGGYFGYLLKIKNIDNGIESDLDFNNEYNKMDYGCALGIGYNYHFNPNNQLSIELRGNYGLITLNKTDTYSFRDTKRNSLNLILNYHFKI